MKILLLFAISVSVAFATSEISPAIVSNAQPGEFPFVASLQLFVFGQSSHFCAAVIIGNIWLLTAANCIMSLPNIGTVEAFVGAHNLAEREQGQRVLHSVSRTILHPTWRPTSRNEPNDIALVRLWNAITFNDRVQPIRLPTAHSFPTGALSFAGWGNIGNFAIELRRVTLPMISNLNDCAYAINRLNFEGRIDTINATNICTGPLTGSFSACNGDFGGPLIQDDGVLVGIASWGVTPCGTVGAPSAVFTRVSAFIDWITDQTGIAP